jgi:restriction endonuclease S subunit
VFLINRGELEGRLDTVFYKPEYLNNEIAIKYSKWGYEKIANLAQRIADGPFGSDLKVDEYQLSGFPLLRVSNIKTGEVEGKLVFISDDKQRQLNRSRVYPNDVLLTKAGAILGYSAVFPKHLREGNITSHLVTITCKATINPFYLSHYFRCHIGQLQIYRWGNKSTRPELNTSEVKNILVTLPPLDIQQQIVDRMEAAHQARKQKEAEAATLLASIDGYLLQALGITLPSPSVGKKCFYTRASKVNGGRFDPAYFDVIFSDLRQSIHEGSYSLVPVGTVCSFLSSGKTPARNEYSENPTEFPIIKVGSYSGGTIDLNKTDYANSRQPHTVQKSDVFVLAAAHQANYVGRFVKQLDENPRIPTSFVGELICLRANPLLMEPDYLFALLSSRTFQTLLNCEKRGQTSHIYPNDIKHVLIPLPPPEKQTEIANYVSAIRAQSKQLRQQAQAEFAQAKIQVERMILGMH